jgi:predicted chitinase
MDGKEFGIDEAAVGETAPPFHPNCGCSIVGVVEEEARVLIKREDIINFSNQYARIYEDGMNNGWKNIAQETVDELNATLTKYDITSQNEINHFLAQCFIESWCGNALTEINWRDYPDTSKDREYFNAKYGDRYDLGNLGKDTDDGFYFRGAGYIQLTGRYNYQKFADEMDDPDIMQGAEYVAENYAWEAAGYYWKNRVQYRFADNGTPTVSQITYDVNGGQYELMARTNAYNLLSEMSQ